MTGGEIQYNYYRDYDPSTGRYIQSDPIGLRGGRNGFTYAANAPVAFTDPLGLFYVMPQRGQTPSSELGGQTELGGIKCGSSGRIEPDIYTTDECLIPCVTAHENRHIDDINHVGESYICNIKDFAGLRIGGDSAAQKNWTELHGHLAELDCLQRTTCQNCSATIQDRIREVEDEIRVLHSRVGASPLNMIPR